jgi:hypothetical protein
MVNKQAWFAHLAKGTRWGRGYVTSQREHKRGHDYSNWFWMTGQPFPGKVHSLRWLIERFDAQGLAVPTWPRTASGQLDWDQVERDTARWSVPHAITTPA